MGDVGKGGVRCEVNKWDWKELRKVEGGKWRNKWRKRNEIEWKRKELGKRKGKKERKWIIGKGRKKWEIENGGREIEKEKEGVGGLKLKVEKIGVVVEGRKKKIDEGKRLEL